MSIKYRVNSSQNTDNGYTTYEEEFEFESFQQLIEYKKWCSRHLVDEAVAVIKGMIPGESAPEKEPTKH